MKKISLIGAGNIGTILAYSISRKMLGNLTVIDVVDGLSDLFEENNLNIFGPKKYFAQLEGSKAFSKRFMRENQLPTADYEEFDNYDDATKYLNSQKIYFMRSRGIYFFTI